VAFVKLLADQETERLWLLDGVVHHLPLLEARFAQLALMEGARRSLATLPAIAYNLVRGLRGLREVEGDLACVCRRRYARPPHPVPSTPPMLSAAACCRGRRGSGACAGLWR
jgi:hypothetical protein